MVIHASILPDLYQLLKQMNEAARELETIAEREVHAIRAFDADMLVELCERRVACHESLNELERECRTLLGNHDIPDDLPMDAILDLLAGHEAASYKALRREVHDRLLHVERQHRENRIRLQAAHDVNNTVLQALGIEQAAQTYGPGNPA